MGLGGAAAIVRTCLRGACALGAIGVELVTRGAHLDLHAAGLLVAGYDVGLRRTQPHLNRWLPR